MTGRGSLDQFVRSYLEIVVNHYEGRGHGWPQDRPALAAFYEWQATTRPDWRIEVQQTVELGDCLVVRALAGGTIAHDEYGSPKAAPSTHAVEWLAVYQVRDRLITAIDVLAIENRAIT
jgi:hypothetical protein